MAGEIETKEDIPSDALESTDGDNEAKTNAKVAVWEYTGPCSKADPYVPGKATLTKEKNPTQYDKNREYLDILINQYSWREISAFEHITRYCSADQYNRLAYEIHNSHMEKGAVAVVYPNWLAFMRQKLNNQSWEPDIEAGKAEAKAGPKKQFVSGYRFVFEWAASLGEWEHSDHMIAQRAEEKKAQHAAEIEAETKAQIAKAEAKTKGTAHGVPCPAPFPGPMAAMVEICLAHQNRRQPDMAVGAALVTMSACLHGRHALEDDLRANLYVVGLVDSGMGKESLLRLFREVTSLCGLPAQSNIGSGQGIEEALRHSQSRRAPFAIDEVAHMIKGYSGAKAQDYQAATGKMLLEYYTASGTVHTTRALADDRKPSIIMYHPYVTLLGMTTPEKMRGINPSLIADGTLGRCLIFRGDDNALLVEDKPKGNRHAELQAAIAQRAIKVSRFAKAMYHDHPISDPNGGNETPMAGLNDGARLYPMSPDAEALALEYGRACDKARQGGDSAANVLKVRALEQAKRIALVLAVWDDAKEVSTAHLQWGIDCVAYCHACLLSFVETMTDSETVQNAERVLGVIRDAVAGKNPFSDNTANKKAAHDHEIPHSVLLKKVSKRIRRQRPDVQR